MNSCYKIFGIRSLSSISVLYQFLNEFLLQKAIKSISCYQGIIGIRLVSSWSVLHHYLNEFLLENQCNQVLELLATFVISLWIPITKKAVKSISWTPGQFIINFWMNSCKEVIRIRLLSSWSVLYHYLNEFLLQKAVKRISWTLGQFCINSWMNFY